MSVFPRKNRKTQSSLNFLQSGPRRFTKSDSSGLAPIRRVPMVFVAYGSPRPEPRPEIGFGLFCLCCEPSDELQESLGPSGPEVPKKSEKKSPGASQKVWNKFRKSPEQTFSRLFETFPDFSDFSETFWGFRAQRARDTPVARGSFPPSGNWV